MPLLFREIDLVGEDRETTKHISRHFLGDLEAPSDIKPSSAMAVGG